jgi:hypothetical protein
MRSDSDIKRDVEDELRWDPDIDVTDVAVSVHSGVVTLTGFVRSYMQKLTAEADAKRVAGVIGVANDIEVRLPSIDERPDPEIARDANYPDQERASVLVGEDKGDRQERLADARRRGGVELPAVQSRAGSSARARCQGRLQHDPSQAAGRAHGDQAQNRGRFAPECRVGRKPHYSRD